MAIICKHCGESINRADLRGFSLICPLCRKPQNGQHPKTEADNLHANNLPRSVIRMIKQ